MKVLVYGNREDETEFFIRANTFGFNIDYVKFNLSRENVQTAKGYDAVVIIVATTVDDTLCGLLKEIGVRYILTRTAGTDHIDAQAVQKHGLLCANVPVYAPNSIAEHAVMLTLELLRKRTAQFRRVEKRNFSLQGLRGTELRGKTVGIIGLGRIGAEVMRDMGGFGCRFLAPADFQNPAVTGQVEYVPFETLMGESDIILLHCPLTKENYHLINRDSIRLLKDGALLVNTARGGLVDSEAVLEALNSGKIAGYALDVYEFENRFSRRNLDGAEIDDPVLEALLRHDQVVFTTHTAFYTEEAVSSMISISLQNLNDFITAGRCENEIK